MYLNLDLLYTHLEGIGRVELLPSEKVDSSLGYVFVSTLFPLVQDLCIVWGPSLLWTSVDGNLKNQNISVI